MNIVVLLLLSAFISANALLLQKNYILTNMSGSQFFCIKNFIIFNIIMLYIILVNRGLFTQIKNIDIKKNYSWLILDALLTIFNVTLWYYLLQNTEAHKLISTVNPLTITLSVVLSYVFYDKIITRNEMVGILFVLLGIVFINKKN